MDFFLGNGTFGDKFKSLSEMSQEIMLPFARKTFSTYLKMHVYIQSFHKKWPIQMKWNNYLSTSITSNKINI